MIVLGLCVVVVLVGLTAAAVLGKLGGGWSDPVSSQRFDDLPDGELGRDDVAALRFDQGLRGYRMDQVDSVITRLTEELEYRDERIAALRARAGETGTPTRDPWPTTGEAGGGSDDADRSDDDRRGGETTGPDRADE